MDESLTMRRRVNDEGLRVVKFCRLRTRPRGEYLLGLSVLGKEAPANSVPAAAVIRRVQALVGITGRKGCVGGDISQM
jgi:hypothetical protein